MKQNQNNYEHEWETGHDTILGFDIQNNIGSHFTHCVNIIGYDKCLSFISHTLCIVQKALNDDESMCGNLCLLLVD